MVVDLTGKGYLNLRVVTRRETTVFGTTMKFPSEDEGLRSEACGVDGGPDMDDPAEQNKPKQSSSDEEEGRSKQPTLYQLAEPWIEETGQTSQDITCGTLRVHIAFELH